MPVPLVISAVALNALNKSLETTYSAFQDYIKEKAIADKNNAKMFKQGDAADIKKYNQQKHSIEISAEYKNADSKAQAEMLKSLDEEIEKIRKKGSLSEKEIQYEQARGRIAAINSKAKLQALSKEEQMQLSCSKNIIAGEENGKEILMEEITVYGAKRKAIEETGDATKRASVEAAMEIKRLQEQEAKEFDDAMKKKEEAIQSLADFDEKMMQKSLYGEERKQAELLANYEKQKAEIEALHEKQLFLAEDEEQIFQEQAGRMLEMEMQYEEEKQAIKDEFARIEAESRQKEADDAKREHEERMKEIEAERDAKLSAVAASFGAMQQITEGYKSYAAIYKASAIGEATVNATQSVLKTMSSTPYPFNVPLAALQAAAAVQVRKIASAKMYAGGMIPGKNTLIMANEEGREAILNPMAVRAVGGPAGVNALNQGTNNYSYDNRQSQNTTVVINTTLLSQKTLRDEVMPAFRWQERRQ